MTIIYKYIFIVLVSTALSPLLSVQATAQTPVPDVIPIDEGKGDPKSSVCLYHPETLIRNRSFFSVKDGIIFYTDGTYWPRPTTALAFIVYEWSSNNYNRKVSAAAASIQFSLNTSNLRALALVTPIHHYTPYLNPKEVPQMTLDSLLKRYLFSGNNNERNTINFWILEIVNSSVNRSCNPWYPYTK